MNALLMVDLQKDFCAGGALAVPGADDVVLLASQLIRHFDLKTATLDWHPADHGAFSVSHEGKKPGDIIELNGLQQVLKPVHCVQHSEGSQFHDDVSLRKIDRVFKKGIDKNVDSFSGFFDIDRRNDTGLAKYLRGKGVKEVYIMGLTTDNCVKYTALDSVDLGFKTYVIEDACRGVELKEGDIASAIQEMKSKGVEIIHSEQLLRM